MIGITKLLCNPETSQEVLRQRRSTGNLPSHLLQFSQEKRPVVVWNVTNRCNLHCIHCYSDAKDREFPWELSTKEGLAVVDDLAGFGVPVIIFSGGDPLLREDLFTLASYAKDKGIRCALSCNGTLIDDHVARAIKTAGFCYVGVSIDGIGGENDLFRGMKGAFDLAVRGIRACKESGLKVGIRSTLSRRTIGQLSDIFDLIEKEDIPRGYFSHLLYSGRGRSLKGEALSPMETRKAIDHIIERTVDFHKRGVEKEIITGSNDADGVYLYLWALKNMPERAEEILKLLKWRGGNSSGVALGNIDSLGNVHPDQFWSHYSLGNVKERPFSEIWTDITDPVLEGLKRKKEMVKGRCSLCTYLDICGGNYRIRAEAEYGDIWAEDPGCYLTDEEIGVEVFKNVKHF